MRTLIVLFICLLTLSLHATTVTWNGTTGDWNDSNNWSGGVLPTAIDDVFINNGHVTISNIVFAKSVRVNSNGNLTINENASLSIANAPNDGIDNQGNIVNNGSIDINETNHHGIKNEGDILNNGLLTIDNVQFRSIYNKYNALFTNTIGSLISIGLTSDESLGIANEDNGSFLNLGSISINTATIGILNLDSSSFINETWGNLIINNAFHGINHEHTASFENKGSIVMNDINGTGINNTSLFTNRASASINIEDSSNAIYGIINSSGGVFDNYGDISIGLLTELSPFNYSIFNDYSSSSSFGALTNHPCGNIEIVNRIAVDGQFINNGYIFQDADEIFIVGDGLSVNNGIIEDVEGSINYMVNNGYIIVPLSGDFIENTSASPILLGSGNDLRIVNDQFYTDSTLTTSAGNYDKVTNTWTPNTIAINHSIIYLQVAKTNGCAKIVSFRLETPVKAECNGIASVNVWTGNGDNLSWQDPFNWSLGVPQPCSQVQIPSTINTTINIDGDAYAASVFSYQSTININTGAHLMIDGNLIGNTDKGLRLNRATLINDGTIEIDNAPNVGLFTGKTSEIINNGLIKIDHQIQESACFLYKSTIINNLNAEFKIGTESSGSIANEYGIYNKSSDIINNGLLEIKNINDKDAIYNFYANFTNEGTIEIENIGGHGIFNKNSTLENNGAISAFQLGGNAYASSTYATLKGNGSVSSNRALSVANISPSPDAAKMNINGKLIFQNSAKYLLSIAGNAGGGLTNGQDLIEVAGDVNFNGTLQVNLLNGFIPTDTDEYVIMTFTGVNVGVFDLSLPSPQMDGWGLVYIPNSITTADPGKVILKKVDNQSLISNDTSQAAPFFDASFNTKTFTKAQEQFVFSVYPNPSVSRLVLTSSSAINDAIELILTDASGKIVRQKRRQLQKGDNTVFDQLQGFPRGMYIISVRDNGDIIWQEKVVLAN